MAHRIHHHDNEFARDRRHINGIESFWSYAKLRLAKLRGRVSESLCLGHNLREKEMSKEKKDARCDDLIDALLEKHGISPEAVLGENGLIAQLKKRVVERALAGELTHHLGYAKGEAPEELDNHRNGYSEKTVVGEDGAMEIEVPRDRGGSFEPLLIAKGQRRFGGFDERIIAMYARGMTVREIQGFLLDHYRVEVRADFISTVTDSVMEAVVEWQNRPLERRYPVVYFDALRVKIRDEGRINKAVYLALGIAEEGCKDVLGIWIEQNEGAKFWLKVMNELRNRGVEDILIAVVDGLKGFPDAITAVFPLACVQTCIVHLMPQLAVVLRVAGPPGRGSRTQGHLSGRNRGGRRQTAQRVRSRPLGQKISDDRRELAPKLATDHPLLRLSAGGAKDHLHHQCH